MLTRDQVHLMLKIRERESIFSGLPAEIFSYIIFDQDPDCDIAIALRHAANAQQEDIDIVVQMVKNDPLILLKAGNVIAPSGLVIKRVALYEFFFGSW